MAPWAASGPELTSTLALPCIATSDGEMDGVPVSLMEAMALGVPVVSTRLSGIPELVRDMETGLLVPPHDSKALADALALLLKDRELAHRLASGGLQHVQREYDLCSNTRLLARLLEQSVQCFRGTTDVQFPVG